MASTRGYLPLSIISVAITRSANLKRRLPKMSMANMVTRKNHSYEWRTAEAAYHCDGNAWNIKVRQYAKGCLPIQRGHNYLERAFVDFAFEPQTRHCHACALLFFPFAKGGT